MTSPLLQLVYVSSAVRPMTTPELTALLEQSRRNNSRLGVTGMLLYRDGNFMQVLEGPPEAVRQLEATIAADPRHDGFIKLYQATVTARDFADWSMGFRDLSAPELASLPGFTPFLHVPLTDASFVRDPSRARRLLQTFRETAR